MSGPRTKRPFAGAASDPSQRQITSFFTTRPGAAPPAGPSPTPIQNGLSSDVQSNLLSVGMRVRKSVPEGYKTGTYSNSKLWIDPTPDRHNPVVRTTTPTISNTRKSRSAAIQRELMPFCGINKIGGLSSQPAASSDEEELEDGLPGLDDMPGLSSSQESVESVESTAGDGNTRKRFFDAEEDAEEPVQMWADRAAWPDNEISPGSVAPSVWANARPLAVPRKSRRKPVLGQENIIVDDFEDADFLVSPDTDMGDA
ncbi:hypothetical protein CCHL11_00805 [Colletotrichum chlorophyti]|uniref:Uncharacterized protein n=1 Tax=Colletotrichum chlorophyti TaxID=708187 RepID=A0A1Q8S5N7_9PEZI|nr:hypothetical protein CCHL11_00805 [Colletotrichum chlorophyti]